MYLFDFLFNPRRTKQHCFLLSVDPAVEEMGNWSTDWSTDQDKKLIKRITAWSVLWSNSKIKVLNFNDLKDLPCLQVQWSVKEREHSRGGKRRRDWTIPLKGPYSLNMVPLWALATFVCCWVANSPPWHEDYLVHHLFNLNGGKRGVCWRSEGTILSNLSPLLLY